MVRCSREKPEARPGLKRPRDDSKEYLGDKGRSRYPKNYTVVVARTRSLLCNRVLLKDSSVVFENRVGLRTTRNIALRR
jgi:hypothetical protein